MTAVTHALSESNIPYTYYLHFATPSPFDAGKCFYHTQKSQPLAKPPNYQAFEFTLRWESVTISTESLWRLDFLCDGVVFDVAMLKFKIGANQTGSFVHLVSFDPQIQTRSSMTFTMQRHVAGVKRQNESDLIRRCSSKLSRLCSIHLELTGTLSSATIESHHDVLFLWKGNKRIRANSKMLSQASPYFKTLLESDFKEGNKQTSYEDEEVPSGQDSTKDDDLEDSDFETDSLCTIYEDEPLRKKQKCEQPFHVIRPRSASTTYRSLLVYLYTDQINFAPLTSTFSSLESAENSSPRPRLQSLQKPQSQDKAFPLPTSPKSIYQLAHLLDLEQLKARAIDNFLSQLTIKNVIQELFKEVCFTYDELRDVALKFAGAHWQEVKRVKDGEGLWSKREREN